MNIWEKLKSKGKQIHLILLNRRVLHFAEQDDFERAMQIATLISNSARQYWGEAHPVFAASLHNLAALHEEVGEYVQAEQLYQQALAIRQRVLEENHPDVIASLNSLAWLYQEVGNYAKAGELLQQVLAITRKHRGEEHPDVAQYLNNLALLYTRMGDYTKAEPLLQQAREIVSKKLGEDDPAVATTLNNLADLSTSMGNYLQAESLYRQALNIRVAHLGEVHPDVVTSLNGLAELYLAQGDYVKALRVLGRAVTLCHAGLDFKERCVTSTLNHTAILYESLGDYTQAREIYEQVLEIDKQTLGESHLEVATDLNNLGSLYHTMGEYAKAVPLLQQALTARRKALGEKHPDVATSLNNLGALYFTIGDSARAESLLQQALAIRRETLGEKHPDVAASLNNLAALYEAGKEYTRAKSLRQQALEILRACFGEEHPEIATNLNNQALLCETLKEYGQAERLFGQALEMRRRLFGQEHPLVAQCLNNLATLYYGLGDYAQAEPLFLQALEMKRSTLGEGHPSFATGLSNLALLCAATDHKDEALTLMTQATAILDRSIGQIFATASERQRMLYLATLRGYLDTFLSLVLLFPSHSSEAVQAGLDVVLRRKAIAAEVLAAQRDALLGGRYPALVPKLRELAALRAQIVQKTLAGPGSVDIQAHRQLLAEWSTQKDQLEEELARQIPEMNLTQKLQSADHRAVAQVLPEEATLVEFARFKNYDFQAVPARGDARWKASRYAAFVLPPAESAGVQLIDLGEADSIDKRVADFITSLANEAGIPRHLKVGRAPSMQEVDASTGSALRAILIDPLSAALGGRRRLFLSPDGDLTRLPFEVLPSDDGHYLIDDYQISYLSAGRDVVRFDTPSNREPAPPLIVADPDFNLCQSDGSGSAAATTGAPQGRRSRDLIPGEHPFDPLPGTRAEGEQIAALLGVRPLLGREALEASLKASRSPRILHIATHGFFLPDQQRDLGKQEADWHMGNGSARGRLEQFLGRQGENVLLRSGLALAGANTWNQGGSLPPEAEDGLLTAEDVSGMDLLDTQLVVLSACETGLGEVQIGEGVFGLRRTFVLAGTRTLVMSLWKVPDQQTRELMEHFYHGILAGQPCVDALRKAQLAMKATYQDPYYWGAFICQGDPNAVPHGT